MKFIRNSFFCCFVIPVLLISAENTNSKPNDEALSKDSDVQNNTEQSIFAYYGVSNQVGQTQIYESFIQGRKFSENKVQWEYTHSTNKNIIIERKLITFGNTPNQSSRADSILYVEDSLLIRATKTNKTIVMIFPNDANFITRSILPGNGFADAQTVKCKRISKFAIQSIKYKNIIYCESRIYEDANGKQLYLITKSYYVANIGLIHELVFDPKHPKKPFSKLYLVNQDN